MYNADSRHPLCGVKVGVGGHGSTGTAQHTYALALV